MVNALALREQSIETLVTLFSQNLCEFMAKQPEHARKTIDMICATHANNVMNIAGVTFDAAALAQEAVERAIQRGSSI